MKSEDVEQLHRCFKLKHPAAEREKMYFSEIRVFRIIYILVLKSAYQCRCFPFEQVSLEIGSFLKSADQVIIPAEITGR